MAQYKYVAEHVDPEVNVSDRIAGTVKAGTLGFAFNAATMHAWDNFRVRAANITKLTIERVREPVTLTAEEAEEAAHLLESKKHHTNTSFALYNKLRGGQ